MAHVTGLAGRVFLGTGTEGLGLGRARSSMGARLGTGNDVTTTGNVVMATGNDHVTP